MQRQANIVEHALPEKALGQAGDFEQRVSLFRTPGHYREAITNQ
jgi:hypothetical protein